MSVSICVSVPLPVFGAALKSLWKNMYIYIYIYKILVGGILQTIPREMEIKLYQLMLRL